MSRIRYLDIHELNDRLKELEGLEEAIDSAQSELDELTAAADESEFEQARNNLESAQANFTDDDRKELEELRDLKDEVGESRGGISEDGGPFIDTRDFEEYAQELAEDIGALDRKASWPMNCIDWKYAAEELSYDYSVVTFRGTDYYYHS